MHHQPIPPRICRSWTGRSDREGGMLLRRTPRITKTCSRISRKSHLLRTVLGNLVKWARHDHTIQRTRLVYSIPRDKPAWNTGKHQFQTRIISYYYIWLQTSFQKTLFVFEFSLNITMHCTDTVPNRRSHCDIVAILENNVFWIRSKQSNKTMEQKCHIKKDPFDWQKKPTRKDAERWKNVENTKRWQNKRQNDKKGRQKIQKIRQHHKKIHGNEKRRQMFRKKV